MRTTFSGITAQAVRMPRDRSTDDGKTVDRGTLVVEVKTGNGGGAALSPAPIISHHCRSEP
jgi:hypothetical protein